MNLPVLHGLLQEIRASIVSPEASTRYRPNNYEIQIPCLPTDSFKVVRSADSSVHGEDF